MKRVLLIYFFVLGGFVVRGQYVPNNGQAFQFISIANPAFSGVENFGDLKMGYRYQWSGFGDHSPKYINLGYDTRLKHPVDLKQNSMRVSRPSLISPENLPRSKRIIHGFGVNVFHSTVGIVTSTGGIVNYAFNYPLSKKFRLAAGLGSVIESRKLKLDDLTFNEPDPFYNHLLTSAPSQLDLSVRGGVLLYSRGFYFGLTYLSAYNQALQASEVALETPFYRGSVQAGFTLNASAALSVKPSVLGYMLTDNSFVIDYSVKAYLDDKGWAGRAYRDSGTGILMLGMNIGESLNASYSYEVGFGGFQPFGGSSHELVLGFRINNLKKEGSWVW